MIKIKTSEPKTIWKANTFLGEGVSKKKYCTSSSSKCKCVPRAAKDIQRGKGNINAFESCEGDDIERW